VYQSRDGAVWAGTLSGGVSRLSQGRFTTYTSADGVASNTVASILESSDGTMWFATPNGLSALSKGHWQTYLGRNGLPSENVNCLLEGSNGVVWIGTTGGLAYLSSGRIQVPAGVPSSLREQILGLAEDRYGWLWISTSNHVLRVNRDKLLSGALMGGDIHAYGIADGLRGLEGVKRHQSVVEDSLGRIWISLNRGISVVDPARLTNSSVPAIVHIQTILADGRPIEPGDLLHLAPGHHRMVFNYVGLSLSVPERVRFRYTLDGLDHGWSEPVAERQAVYTNLGPGSYSFHVMASNPDGVWGKDEAAVSFAVDPLFWQTWWFWAAVVLASVVAAAALYRLRLHQLTSRLNVRFEERLAERTRIAQELHDTLLQGFQGLVLHFQAVVKHLPDQEPAWLMMKKALTVADEVLVEGRERVRGLRAEGRSANDLPQTLASYGEELALGSAVAFKVTAVGAPQLLHPVVGDEIYRIAREAVINAFRHSEPSSVEVEITYGPANFCLRVRDNGCGIDQNVLISGRQGHWGLSGMRERAQNIRGHLRIWSNPGAGTEIDLSVPAKVVYARSEKQSSFRWLRQGANGGW
jgi:signal transduction histidine kinase